MSELTLTPKPRDMTQDDLEKVVELHIQCFPNYFLTGLGKDILWCFYAKTVNDSHSVAAVLEIPETGSIIGLATSTLDPGFHTKLMRSHLFRFLKAVLQGVFTSDAVRQGIWRRFGFVKRLFRAKADSGLADAGIPPAKGIEARFLGVAVHPEYRGDRNAERLVEYFANRVFKAGAVRLGGSVFPENLASLILYKRLGWNVMKTGPNRVDVWVDHKETDS